jgi:hypothetical protein
MKPGLFLKILPETVRNTEVGIPLRMFPGGQHPVASNLVGAFFTGNPGEIDIMLYSLVIQHDHEYQVFIDGGA